MAAERERERAYRRRTNLRSQASHTIPISSSLAVSRRAHGRKLNGTFQDILLRSLRPTFKHQLLLLRQPRWFADNSLSGFICMRWSASLCLSKSVRVCVCVCPYVFLFVYACISLWAPVYSVHVCLCVCASVCVCVCVCMCDCLCDCHTDSRVSVCMSVCLLNT